tara:strand:+ start:315 stop:626 length:312 start_codon:yes stop_codon:yes gene_type:complete
MGKMKEEFMKQQERNMISDAVDAFMDDDYQLEEYYASIKPEDDCCGGDCHCKGESTTQEEVQENHNAWWDSLTDEQKQQLFDSKEALFELTIEEMNHDLSFGK